MAMQWVHEELIVLRASNLGIQRVVINDIVAMHATRACAQIARGVTVADAERRKIRTQYRGLPKSELAVELQAVGRDWNGRPSRHDLSLQATDPPPWRVSTCRQPGKTI